jgi:hypothetical protein
MARIDTLVFELFDTIAHGEEYHQSYEIFICKVTVAKIGGQDIFMGIEELEDFNTPPQPDCHFAMSNVLWYNRCNTSLTLGSSDFGVIPIEDKEI